MLKESEFLTFLNLRQLLFILTCACFDKTIPITIVSSFIQLSAGKIKFATLYQPFICFLQFLFLLPDFRFYFFHFLICFSHTLSFFNDWFDSFKKFSSHFKENVQLFRQAFPDIFLIAIVLQEFVCLRFIALRLFFLGNLFWFCIFFRGSGFIVQHPFKLIQLLLVKLIFVIIIGDSIGHFLQNTLGVIIVPLLILPSPFVIISEKEIIAGQSEPQGNTIRAEYFLIVHESLLWDL